MKKHDTIRQGDVLLVYIGDDAPDGLTEVEHEGRVILAYGEVTGHAHAINSGAKMFRFDPDKGYQGIVSDTLVQVSRPAALTHEEHDRIELPAGNYLLVHQVEYTPEELRRVQD